MIVQTGISTTTAAMVLVLAVITPAWAKTFTVNSTADPAVVKHSNCKNPTRPCSLREALAFADKTKHRDTIRFDVDGPIVLTRKLSAKKAVHIDGGAGTTISIDQGYSITELPDAFAPYEDVLVLQPNYYSENGPTRAMLELEGDGSIVSNLTFDGGIIPAAEDLGVARIDFDSDNNTDFLLFTIDGGGGSDRWLVSGGVYTEFGNAPEPGKVDISNNQFVNMGSEPITVTFSDGANITGNALSGGPGLVPFAATDGIFLYSAPNAVISDNSITQYRTGITIRGVSGTIIRGNHLLQNLTGMDAEPIDGLSTQVTVEDNTVTGNAVSGITVIGITDALVSGNIANGNGYGCPAPECGFGILVGGGSSALITDNQASGNQGGVVLASAENGTVAMNQAISNTRFGIAIAGGEDHLVNANTASHSASGDGIVLVEATRSNTFTNNETNSNNIGIVAGAGDPPYPANNTFDGNTALDNTLVDILDLDPVCNDAWANSTYGSSFAVSGTCID